MILKLSNKYYEDKDYCCPNCGCESKFCKSNGNYGYICRDCETEFETPDT